MPDVEHGGRAIHRVSTLIVGDGALLIPCAEILLRHGHTIQAIVSANGVIQEWAREQKIRYVSRQDEVLSVMDGRPFDYLFRKEAVSSGFPHGPARSRTADASTPR